MTVGKKVGGFVLQVAARVVSKHSLNVMAGHDDIYALLSSGYTVLFGANPQEAADLAAISYRTAALSLIPVANAMDGFATSHMMSEAPLPEPALLKEYLGDPAGRIACPTLALVPADLRDAYQKGTRQLVPALVDPDNPGMTGPVQNQPDFQAGAVDHRTHFESAVPALARRAMAEYGELTGRHYEPLMTYRCDDAEVVMVALGSVTDDVRAVLAHVRGLGIKAGLVSVKMLQRFPEEDFVAAVAGKRAVLVLERSDQVELTRLVTTALYKGLDPAVPPATGSARWARCRCSARRSSASGGHDLQPRHLIAAFKRLDAEDLPPMIYLGSQFFDPNATGELLAIQDRLGQADPETAAMALQTEANPSDLLPPQTLRLRFHSVGGYGTIATGKLLTDILSGVLGMHSFRSPPETGSSQASPPGPRGRGRGPSSGPLEPPGRVSAGGPCSAG